MKRWKRLSLTSIAAVLPVAAVVSCSKWSGWSKSNSDSHEDYKFDKHVSASKEDYEIRNYTEIEKGITRSNSGTEKIVDIDLSKLNNAYELIEVIVKEINIKSKDSIGEYWDYDRWGDMVTYIDGVNSKITFNFNYKGVNSTSKFDFEKITNGIVSDLKAEIAKGDDKLALHAFKVEVDKTGNPLKPDEIVNFAANDGTTNPLIGIPIVGRLVSFKSDFAITMQKLVNLPKKSLGYFKLLLMQMDRIIETVFSNDDKNAVQNWMKNIKSFVGPKAFVFERLIDSPLDEITHTLNFKAMFLIEALKK